MSKPSISDVIERGHSRIRPAESLIGAIDIGTAKICCLIGAASDGESGPRRAAPENIRFLGLGHQRSRGVKAGMIVDLNEAEHAIRAAVAQAERAAGVTLDRVDVSISGGHLHSAHFTASADVEHGAVTDGDIARLLDGARSFAEREGRALIHMNGLGYRLDQAAGISEPRGMAGRQLSSVMHAVTADDSAARNLRLLIERCVLRPQRLVPSALASARAVAHPDELRHGVVVVDMGAGATQIAVIADNSDMFADTISIGGNHITYDIMRALDASLAEAERIKVLYGTMVEAGSDERDVVTYPRLSDDEPELYHTTRAQLRALIRPRVESLLDQVMDRLGAGGVLGYAGNRVVLTGGAAQLVGLADFAARRLDRTVRLGRPFALPGMVDSMCGPALATVIGLVAAAGSNPTVPIDRLHESGPRHGYLGRMGQWLRESF